MTDFHNAVIPNLQFETKRRCVSSLVALRSSQEAVEKPFVRIRESQATPCLCGWCLVRSRSHRPIVVGAIACVIKLLAEDNEGSDVQHDQSHSRLEPLSSALAAVCSTFHAAY